VRAADVHERLDEFPAIRPAFLFNDGEPPFEQGGRRFRIEIERRQL
jgi:hypothetical protein